MHRKLHAVKNPSSFALAFARGMAVSMGYGQRKWLKNPGLINEIVSAKKDPNEDKPKMQTNR